MADPADDLLPLIGIGFNNEPAEDESSDSSISGDSESDSGDQEEMEEENDGVDQAVDEAGGVHVAVIDGDGDAERANGLRRKEMRKLSRRRRREEREKSQMIVNFDKSLPSTHSYLGNDMDELRGRTIFDENSVVSLPILILPNVVLVPGQVIPLFLNSFQNVAMVRRAAESDKTFGILNLIHTENNGSVSDIGCTAEILCIKDESDSSLSMLRAKAVGRQRFKVTESLIRDIAGGLKANVKILPELIVSHALDGAGVRSCSRLMAPTQSQDSDVMVKTAVGIRGQVLSTLDFRPTHRPLNKLFLSHSTPWPAWVYRMYDVDYLCEQIKVELSSWSGISLPKDPITLSYWIAHNLPVDDSTRLFILSLDSVVQRLRFGLSVLKKTGVVLQCKECMLEISSKDHVFSMTEEGPVGAFVNPGGYVHEMFTVHDAKNLSHIGRPSTEHSWFPGYAWTIIQCKNCRSHMGWKFTAAKSHLAPRKFWGLCRSSVETIFATTTEDEKNSSHPIYIM